MCDSEALLKVLSSSQLCSSPITDPTKALVWGQTRDTPVEQELALPWVSLHLQQPDAAPHHLALRATGHCAQLVVPPGLA